VTQEGTSETEKWVANKGAKYAYAYDKGGKLARYFGVEGIPDAVLVDAMGKVVWRGHPGGLEESTIGSALQGALPKPLWEWSGGAKGVKGALLKRSYKSALDQAAKLGEADGGPEILAAIQGVVKSNVDGLRACFEKGDYLGAQTAAQRLEKDMVGLPEVEEAAKVLSSIAADKNAQNVIKGQQKLAKIRDGENTKRKELEAAIESARKVLKEYPGTYVEKEAGELIASLNGALRSLKNR
jgi:thioredoxin-like negative regulator of GroEL